MTFVEAAVQILRREGKPLHIKELTRLAIKHNLLSVVGRDPEAMMETRRLRPLGSTSSYRATPCGR